MMKQWKNVREWAVSLVLTALLVCSLLAGGKAYAVGESGLEDFFYAAMNKEGTAWSFAVLINQPGKGIHAYTFKDETYNNSSECSVQRTSGENPAQYPLQYVETAGGLMVWDVPDFDDNFGVINAGMPVKGEKVDIVYFRMDENENISLEVISGKIAALSKKFDDGTAFLQLDDAVSDLAFPPAILVNENAECVGILDESVVYAEYFDEGVFNGGSSSSGDSKGDSGNSGGDSGDPNTDLPDPSTTGSGVAASARIADIVYIVIGAAVFAAGIFGFRKLRKRKPEPPVESQENHPNPPDRNRIGETEPLPNDPPTLPAFPPTAPPGDIPETEPLPNDPPILPAFPPTAPPEDIPETQPEDASASLYLVCSGGYMDGRIYPIEGPVMTIGRGAACTIKYPADYAGISREHVILQLEGGSLTLMDTSSTGTFLKRTGGKLPQRQPIPLSQGDIFYLGERKNRFEIVQR